MDNFRIYFTNRPARTDDRFTITVNDCIINTYPLDTNLVEFDCELVTGWNSLRIVYNRPSADGAVSIDEVYINKSAMKYLLNDYGQVIPDWRQDPMLKQWYVSNQGSAPDAFPKRKILDMPGTYEFRFRVPLKDFFEEFYQIPEHYRKQYNQPIEKYQRLEEMLHNAKAQ